MFLKNAAALPPVAALPLAAALAMVPCTGPYAQAQAITGAEKTLADASALPASTSDIFEKDDQTDDVSARYHHDRMTVPVTIDGNGPHAFLVDTGSETTVISNQLAQSLGILTSGTATLIGSVATKGVGTTRLSTLSVGRKTIEDLPAVLLDGNHLGAAGILGIDTLRGHRVIFDFANDSISIADSVRLRPGASYEIVVRAKRKQDRMVISNARIDGVKVQMIIDTGSNYSIGNTAQRDRLREDATFGFAGIMDVTGAELSTDIVVIRNIQFDSLRLNKSFLLISDSPAFAELGLDDEPAMLLGMNHLRAFSRMSVDFSRREVAFDLAQ